MKISCICQLIDFRKADFLFINRVGDTHSICLMFLVDLMNVIPQSTCPLPPAAPIFSIILAI